MHIPAGCDAGCGAGLGCTVPAIVYQYEKSRRRPDRLTLTIALFLLTYSGNITALATSSREAWAFSRDRGFPFSRTISTLNQKRHVPANAVFLTTLLTLILCLSHKPWLDYRVQCNWVTLPVGPTLHLHGLDSLCFEETNTERTTSASSLGSGVWGLPINAFAVAYSAFAIVFSCFPVTVPVSSARWYDFDRSNGA